MAQLDRRAGGRRDLVALLRQRPGLCASALLACVALLAVVALGVTGGFGATTVRVERGSAPAAQGSDEAAGSSGAGEEDESPSSTEEDTLAEKDAAEPEELLVDVGGAVAAPGVVRVAAGARVTDAVAAAGGLTAEADTATLNLAAKLEDGQKVYVPTAGETMPAAAGGGSADAGGAAGGAGSAGAGGATSGLVNINTASADELDALPGVGPATAQAIIDERDSNGAFTSAEDIMRVSGIGEKKFAKLKSSICV